MLYESTDEHLTTTTVGRIPTPRAFLTTMWVTGVVALSSLPAATAEPMARHLRAAASASASTSASVDLDNEDCVAPCATLHRRTVACSTEANNTVTPTCGKCLPGFDGPDTPVTVACVVDEEYWTGPDYDGDGSHNYPYPSPREGSGMSTQATLGSALGSVVVLLMCLITWRGWIDCCSRRRKRDQHRAFMEATTKEWSCHVCLHENSSLRRYCVMCKTECSDKETEIEVSASAASAVSAAKNLRVIDDGYVLVETPRSSSRTAASRGFAAAEWTEEQMIASERLEWKRCITKGQMRWLRFRAEEVRRYPKLRGTVLDTKQLATLDLFPRSCGGQGVQSTAPMDDFFVLVPNQAVHQWHPVEHATFESRPYKHWRAFQKIASSSFDERLRWFYQEVMKLQHPMMEDKFTIHVHRQHILKQTMQLFQSAQVSSLRRHLRVDFMDEPGVDGGGILREWLQLLCRELFSESLGLFKRTASTVDGGYWISQTSTNKSSNLEMYTFFGQLLAKALLEGLVLNVRLCTPFLKHLLGSPLSKEDIRFLDEQIYSSICYILENDNIDQLCLTFSVGDQDLISQGSETPVTDSNKNLYVDHLVRYYLFDNVEQELRCIREGFRSILPETLLHIFDHKELDLVLSGLSEINVLDWQAHTNVCLLGHHPDEEEQVVDWFWEIVEELDQRGRSRLLQYVTGSSGVPVEGFSALTSLDGRLQHFTIQLTENASRTYSTMPYASTCFNRLDLPVYERREEVEEMLHMLVEIDVTGFNRR